MAVMNLKTHTGYPEIVVDEEFKWMLADKNGRVDNPAEAPANSDISNVFPWTAKILDMHGKPLEEFEGEATSRKDAIIAARAKIDVVVDDYIRPSAEEGEA